MNRKISRTEPSKKRFFQPQTTDHRRIFNWHFKDGVFDINPLLNSLCSKGTLKVRTGADVLMLGSLWNLGGEKTKGQQSESWADRRF